MEHVEGKNTLQPPPDVAPSGVASERAYEHKYENDGNDDDRTGTSSRSIFSSSSSIPSSFDGEAVGDGFAAEESSSLTVQASAISSDPVAQDIASGFRINYMTMRDAISGTEVWNSGTHWDEGLFENELVAHVPASILQCAAVAREINFSSREEIENFRLEQRVYFEGMLMEEWFFDFGFVIPGSTNTWQSTIEAAGEGQMLPASILNGKVQIVTSFFDGPLFVSKSTVRVFYDK